MDLGMKGLLALSVLSVIAVVYLSFVFYCCVHDEKDEVIKALQQQINGNGATSRTNPSFDAFATSPVSPQTVDIDALGELEALVSALRRENTELRLELESIDPNVVNERDDLRRRVTSQNFLLSSYEDLSLIHI